MVLAYRDPLAVGPLGDVDGSLIERRKFWALIGVPDEEWEHDRKVDREAWAKLISPGATIVTWRGLDADGYLLSLRVAAKVRGTTVRLFEIVNTRFNNHLGPFYSSIGIQNPVELAAIRANAKEVIGVEPMMLVASVRAIAASGNGHRHKRGRRTRPPVRGERRKGAGRGGSSTWHTTQASVVGSKTSTNPQSIMDFSSHHFPLDRWI